MWGAPQALRAAGAAKAMGKQPGKQPATRPNNAKPIRMPSQHNAPATRPPQMRNANHPQSKGPAHAGPQSYLEMNPAQLQHFATKQVQGETKTGLAPYQQKAGEITGTEQTVAKRFGGYGEATDKLLGGLQSGAEGSAKTYGNMAADAALKAQTDLGSVGQNTQAQNGNYLDPQVKAALANQSANVGAIGAARQTGAETLGQNEQNLLTNMRAAAAQRVTEGQQGIASTFGKQRAQNQAGENALLARQPGAISKLQTELTQKAFNAKATEQGLGIKIQGLGQKAQETKARVGATERGQNLSREAARERNDIARQAQGFNEWAGRQKVDISKLSAEDKSRYDEAQVRYKRHLEANGGKPPSPKEGRTYMDKLAKAESAVRSALGNQREGSKPEKHAKEEAIRAKLRSENVSDDVISAALNLAVYGRLGPMDQHIAESYGLTKNLRPQWFKGK